MSGKPKQPVYHYDTKENRYRYLGMFESRSEVFKMYYDGKKGRLFNTYAPYRELEDGTYVTKERLGRKGLYEAIRKYDCPLNSKREDDKIIEIFNFDGNKIGEVANRRVLEALCNSNMQTFNKYLLDTENTVENPRIGTPLVRYKKSLA